MAKHTITIDYDKFTAQIVNSKRSTLGKRGITGGVEVDFSKIPDQIVTNLLIDAVRNYMQVGLKTINQETATVEDCQAAMRARLALLESGAVTAPGQGRKAPTRDPVKAAAKLSVRKALQGRTEEKLDAKVLTTTVNDLFKLHAAWVKEGSAADHPRAKAAMMVENALKAAQAAHDAQREMDESLAPLAAKAAKLSAEAKAKREAEATEAGEEAEATAEAKPAPKKQAKKATQGRGA